MAYSAFGINYDTAAKISAYGGDAEHPMSKVLSEGLTHPPGGAGRRGGRAARFGA